MKENIITALPCGHGSFHYIGSSASGVHDKVFRCDVCERTYGYTAEEAKSRGYEPLYKYSETQKLQVEAAGVKKDKPRYSIVFRSMLNGIVASRMRGYKKYGPFKDWSAFIDSWKMFDSDVYVEALLRHAIAVSEQFYNKTTTYEESLKIHLENAAVNIMFLLEKLDKEGKL